MDDSYWHVNNNSVEFRTPAYNRCNLHPSIAVYRKTSKTKQKKLAKKQQTDKSVAPGILEHTPRKKPYRKSYCSFWVTPPVPNPRLYRHVPAKPTLVTHNICADHRRVIPLNKPYQSPNLDLDNATPAARVIQKLTDSLKPTQRPAPRQTKITTRTVKKKIQKRRSKISLHIRIPQPESSNSAKQNEVKSPYSKYKSVPETESPKSKEYKHIQSHRVAQTSKQRSEKSAIKNLRNAQEELGVSRNPTYTRIPFSAPPLRAASYQFVNPYIVKRHSLEIDSLKDKYSPEFLSSLYKVASTGVPISWTINNWEHREDFKAPTIQKCGDSLLEASSSLPQGDFSIPFLSGENLVTCALLKPHSKTNTSSPLQSVGSLESRLPAGAINEMGSKAVRKKLAFWRNQSDLSNGNGSSPESSDYVDDFGTTPSEYLSEFLTATMQHRYKEALKYCKIILEYEPNNRTAKDLYPLLKRRSANEEKEDISDKEETDHDDTQSDTDKEDSSDSSNESTSSSDEDLDEEEGADADADADAPATSSDSRMEESSRFSASHSPHTNGETDSAAYNLSGLDDDDDYKVLEYDDDNGNAVPSNKDNYEENFNTPGIDELDDKHNDSPTSIAQLQEISSPQHNSSNSAEKLRKLRAQFVHHSK